MGYFEDIQNPWSPGGQMSPRLPWAQPGLNYGWGHGNEFFHPKTKEQIQEEALMQLAVLAVVLVAPALVGAGGGAGAGGSIGSGAGTVGGSLGSGGGIGGSVGAGMGTSAEAAGGILTQAEAVSGLVDSTLMAAPMVPAAGAGAGAASGGGGALAGVLGVAQVLMPFLQGDSRRVLRSAAQKGPEYLNRELHRRTKDCDCPPKPKFRTEDWQHKYEDCGCKSGDSKSGANHSHLNLDGKPHDAVPALENVIDMLRKDISLQNELRKVDHCCTTSLSAGAERKLMKGIGESLPLSRRGIKALEGVMDFSVPNDLSESTRRSGFNIKKYSGFVGSIIERYFDYLLITNSVMQKYLNPYRNGADFDAMYELRFDELGDRKESANTVHLFVSRGVPWKDIDFARTTFESRCKAFRPPNEAMEPMSANDNFLIRTDLAIARTVIHEAIHAYLGWKTDHDEWFKAELVNDYDGDEHEYMASKLRDVLIEGMKEFANDAGVDGLSDHDFDILSWVGLQQTNEYQKQFPTLEDRERHSLEVIKLEFSNNGFGDVSSNSYRAKRAYLLKKCPE